MPFCPGDVINCNDNTCLLYQKHNTCIGHEFHLGDRIEKNGKYGYIYDVNPLGSKRSITIIYDDDSMEKVFGYSTCAYINTVVAPRDLTKINAKYK